MSRRILGALCVLLTLAPTLHAQTPSGEISGVVTDASGSVLPGVRVTLTNAATNAVREVTDQRVGHLSSIPALQPGVYTLKAERQGSAPSSAPTSRCSSAARTGSRSPSTSAQLTDIVEVTGGAPHAADRERLHRHGDREPQHRRAAAQRAQLPAARLAHAGRHDQRSFVQSGPAAHGRPAQQLRAQRRRAARPLQPLLARRGREHRPELQQLHAAAVGRRAAGVQGRSRALRRRVRPRDCADQRLDQIRDESVPRQPLSNSSRDSALDAKNYFDRADRADPALQAQTVRRHGGRAGGHSEARERKRQAVLHVQLGGPARGKVADLVALAAALGLAHRRFLAAARRRRQPDPDLRSGHARLRRGGKRDPGAHALPGQHHSGEPDSSGVERQLLDVLSAAASGADRREFHQQRSPARRCRPVHLPDRLHVESSKSNWFFRHSISHELGYDPFAIPDMGINTDTDVHQGVLANTRTFGSNKVNDLRVGYGKLDNAPHLAARQHGQRGRGARHQPADATTRSTGAFPTSASPACPAWARRATRRSSTTTRRIQVVDNFSWSVGEHAFKFGGEVRRVLYDQIGGVVTRGRFAFDGRYTQNPLLPAAQRGGRGVRRLPARTLQPIRRAGRRAHRQLPLELLRALRAGQLEGAAERSRSTTGCAGSTTSPSTTRTTPSSTSTSSGTTRHEPVFVRAGTGDPYEGNPAFRLAPDIQYVRDGRFGRGAYRSDFNDFAPRLGIAWTVTPKTVVRTGGGIYYVRDIGNAVFDIVRNAPFTIRRDEPAESFRPNLSFEQPFARTGAPTFILANQYDEPSSYISQWSFGVQRELPGAMTVEATYFGSAGVQLRRLMSYNNPEPSQLPNTNLARPFPKFGSIQVMSAPSHSSYHALYLKVQRRFSRRLELPQLLLLWQVDRQRQRRAHHRWRLADAVERLRPPARARAVGIRLPQTLDDVVAVGTAVRQGRALVEAPRRRRLPTRRLAVGRHPHDAGRLPVHRAVRAGQHPERRRHLLPGLHGHRLAAAGRASTAARAGSTPTRSSTATRRAARSATAPSRGTRSSARASSASTPRRTRSSAWATELLRVPRSRCSTSRTCPSGGSRGTSFARRTSA